MKQPYLPGSFISGLSNDISLKTRWFTDLENKVVFAETVIDEKYQGYNGVSHGGILASLLDEALLRAVAVEEKERFVTESFFVTKNMSVKYILPTPINEQVKVVAWIEKIEGKYFSTAGQIALNDQTITVTGEATIVKIPKELTDQLGMSAESFVLEDK